MRRLASILGVFAIASAAAFAGVDDPDRGRTLYETHCGNCHSTSVHGRAVRAATDFPSLRGWVLRWNSNLKLGWSDEDIDQVAIYLNNAYYHYPCPPYVCKVVSFRDVRLP